MGTREWKIAGTAYIELMEMYHVNFNCFAVDYSSVNTCNFIAATPNEVIYTEAMNEMLEQ